LPESLLPFISLGNLRAGTIGYHKTFIPQSYSWGTEAQVDWYEADICAERQLAYVFYKRSMASGGAFHGTFPASQQAFLEAHERGFAYFWGRIQNSSLWQPQECRQKGSTRPPARGNYAIYRFSIGASSRSSAHQQKRTKGGVEGEGGYFRRNHLVPVPKVDSWGELNIMLLEASKNDEQRMINGRTQTVGTGMNLQREHLRALPEEGFDLTAVHFQHVSASGCLGVLTNFYSVPLPVGQAGEHARHTNKKGPRHQPQPSIKIMLFFQPSTIYQNLPD
jgi:hypothetical protein